MNDFDGSIGDDIEFMNNSFRHTNTEFSKKLFSLRLLETSHSFKVIQCERSSMPISFFNPGYFYLALFFKLSALMLLLWMFLTCQIKFTANNCSELILVVICVILCIILFVLQLYLLSINYLLDVTIIMNFHSILFSSSTRLFKMCLNTLFFFSYLLISTGVLYSFLIGIFSSFELDDILSFLRMCPRLIHSLYMLNMFHRIGISLFPTSLSWIWHSCVILLFDFL